MLKIRALNRESSSDEDVPVIRREAQEEIALEQYNKALRLLALEGSQAESILLKLVDENIPLLENNGGLPKSMSTLKYSCFVNLGNIYLKENKVNEALEKYLTASELDSTDVTLWYKIGKLSLKEEKFRQSAYAFSKGLECSESHWPCLDQLISVLFAIKDTIACLVYIGKALMLDADYSKGLVLRKQIYRDNPATKEYYQLYNPDCIWEPPLDVDIDEEDEKKYLEEAQVLCNRVIEVEKSYGPKPLQTIPLPKALEDHTWLSLAKTVTYLHQYMTDNEMSHFTMIDMSKCMSQSSESASMSPEVKIENTFSEVSDKPPEEKCVENVTETVVESEVKMEVEFVPERRFSQTSENNDGQENTPIQTDNDEEQNMDQDIEEPAENSESKAERGRPRGSKRKRDLLSDLQIWGWHSKRKQSKKAKEKDFTVEDALNRIIPKTLLHNKIDPEKYNQMEDSMDTMDLYNLYVEDHNLNYLSPIHSPKSVNYEPYFGTDRESEDVSQFWTKKRDYCDAVVLVKELVFALSKLWTYKWPKELVPLYVEAYDMFREHCDPPEVFCGDSTFQEIRNDALATILYGELLSFSSDSKKTIHPSSLGYLQLVSGWEDQWQHEYASFFNRVFWLRSHIFRKENSNDLAIRSLELVQEVIAEEEAGSNERYLLSLPNCFRYGLITNQIAEKIIKHLEMINSLGTVEGLFNAERYTEVADILKLTFNASGNHPQVGRMGRPAQLALLMHSLWFTDLTECFVWTEECLYEALDHYLKPTKDPDKWERVLEKCVAILQEIIKKETVRVIDSLREERRARLVESLSKIASKQLNTDRLYGGIPLGCITPWILLHYVLMREEQREYAIKRISQGKRDKTDGPHDNQETHEVELPPSVAILFSGHEFLGPKGWCLTGQGELLHFILDTVLDRLDTPVFDRLRDKIDIHIEQALFCLYEHPSKKNKISRHLADHNVDPLPLTWERSFQLYEFYGPDRLPEFNSYKNASISTDLEQLLKRIIALVPPDCAPQQHLPKITDYIYGKTTKCPDPIEFPNKVRAIYYLIGDFHFKQREFGRCIKYFQMDLCINPHRLDSWACLGLSYTAQLDSKLNYCEKFKTETEFLDKAKYASICFERALSISPDPLMLWIEYGTFQYTVHSYCSRILKYESENLSMEKFEFLENQKNSYLDSSGDSFEKAIALYEIDDTNEQDERWLQYYILGKIAEKKQKEPAEYLQYYMTASTLLDENNATYPERIFYNNPQHLAVEALELHYRVHASVLKYLELHEGKEIPNSLGAFFKKCLSSSKFFKKPPPPKPAPEIPTKSAENTSLGFQEQFLNSLNKPIDDGIIKPVNDEKTPDVDKTIVPEENTLVASPPKSGTSAGEKENQEKEAPKAGEVSMAVEVPKAVEVPRAVEVPPKAVEVPPKAVEVPPKAEEVPPKAVELTKSVELPESVEMPKVLERPKEEEDVIMISDSDDEQSTTDVAKPEDKNIEPVPAEQPNERIKVKDVQQMLDEMMVKQMKEVEQQPSEVDSDLSGTEKVEEVVCKEDKMEVKAEGKPEAAKIKEKPKKVKPSDSETDTDNVRTSIDDESSSSSSSSSSTSSSSDSDSDDDDSSSSSSSSSSEPNNENMSNSEILALVDRCVAGLEICISRLTQNYKALYRLAHLYFYYKPKKDLTKCKQLLLGEYKCKNGTVVTGLFYERKVNNFFNGIWRIPSTEIDRPGSLSAHMSRCISLLLQILMNTNDNKTLIELCTQLRRTPEQDKTYIKESERIAFSDQALEMCTQSLRNQMKNISTMSNPEIAKLLQEIFRVHQKVQKHIPGKESGFANMLIEVYRKFIKEKIPENVNVLELATKFCQQNRPVEKPKIQPVQNPIPPMPRGPGIASPPVLPPPSSMAPAQVVPLKRPGMGRPRGRPPLPKVPGQMRQPRGKSPNLAGMSKSYAWQKSLFDQSYAYEYLKHYHDELIKQYSQNLSMQQLTQLSQILNQGQLSNPLTASAITNQFLAQTGLLTPSALVKQMSSTTAALGQSSTQLMESLNHLNPSLKKKLGVDQALSSLTTDQLKFLGSMLPSATKAQTSTSRHTLPHTVTSSSGVMPNKPKPLHVPNPKPSTSAGAKPLLPDPGRAKQGSVIAKTTTPSTQLFKEPPPTKTPSPDEKAAKVLMKDRPSISITPVTGSLPPPATSVTSFPRPSVPSTSPTNFTRPTMTTSPSSGKTLQEKLAEKKKEQFNKEQLKKTAQAELYNSEALIKSLNLPSIPSSLTVSKASIPITSSYPVMPPPVTKPTPNIPKSVQNIQMASTSKPVPNIPKQIPSSIAKFPMDLGRPVTIMAAKSVAPQPKFTMEPSIPPNLTVSKATAPLPTPKFTLESGISISQVPVSLSTKSGERKSTFVSKKDSPSSAFKSFSGTAVDISPVLHKSPEKPPSKVYPKESNRDIPKKSLESPKKTIDVGLKSGFPTNQSTKIDFNSALARSLMAGPSVSISKSGPSVSTVSHSQLEKNIPPGIRMRKIPGDPKSAKPEQSSLVRKEGSVPKPTIPRSSPSQRRESSDDDVICID